MRSSSAFPAMNWGKDRISGSSRALAGWLAKSLGIRTVEARRSAGTLPIPGVLEVDHPDDAHVDREGDLRDDLGRVLARSLFRAIAPPASI